MKSPTPRPKSTCPKSGKDHQHLANKPPSEQSNLARRGQRLHQGHIHLQKPKALTRARPFFDGLCVAFFGRETMRGPLPNRTADKLNKGDRQPARIGQTPGIGIEVQIQGRGERIPENLVVKNEMIGKTAIAPVVVTEDNTTRADLVTRRSTGVASLATTVNVLTIGLRGVQNLGSLHARAALGIQAKSRAKNEVPKRAHVRQPPAKFMKANENRDAIDIQLPVVRMFGIPTRCQ